MAAACAAVVLSAPAVARAGGYDTPMLYTARHMGMGGAAIGYVRDPSALFHNPAGLGQVRGTALLGDLSLLIGDIHGSPDVTALDSESETTFAPFFFAGGAHRFHELVVVGLGLFPIASAGATYEYGPPGFEDRTSLYFFEASPGVAVNLPQDVRLGLAYRVTFARLERFKGQTEGGGTPFIDFTLTGWDFSGLRAGAQWTAAPWLELGLAYRHRVDIEVSNDDGVAIARRFTDVSTELTLPAKLGFGTRFDLEPFGPHASLAVDVEYTFQSQNQANPLEGDPVPAPGEPAPARATVPNVFDWRNSVTLRVGAEYRLLRDEAARLDRLALRAGYVFDSQTANERYPTPFGTPPAPTNVFTVGTGWNGGAWQANLAYAYRFGSGEVTTDDLTAPDRLACQFCGVQGEYAIHLNGFYVDAGVEF